MNYDLVCPEHGTISIVGVPRGASVCCVKCIREDAARP